MAAGVHVSTESQKNAVLVLLKLKIYFSEKFGLFGVNVNSSDKERIPKKSADFYRRVTDTKEIPQE